MSKPRTFTCTIFCGNCRNVGEYEFRRGSVLQTDDARAEYEARALTPNGRITTIHVNGRRVYCKFCNVPTSMHLRERKGDAPVIEEKPTHVCCHVAHQPPPGAVGHSCCIHRNGEPPIEPEAAGV